MGDRQQLSFEVEPGEDPIAALHRELAEVRRRQQHHPDHDGPPRTAAGYRAFPPRYHVTAMITIDGLLDEPHARAALARLGEHASVVGAAGRRRRRVARLRLR